MNVSLHLMGDELADATAHTAYVQDGRTMIQTRHDRDHGGQHLCVWANASEASSIATAWAEIAAQLAGAERERNWPTLEEVTADRDDALAVEAAP